MTPDTLKKFVVKIIYENNRGSGVIFRAKESYNTFYVITAKHNFFANENDANGHKENEKTIIDESLEIYLEIPTDQRVKITNNKVYFLNTQETFDNESVDLAILVVDYEHSPSISNLSSLEIYDIDINNNIPKNYYNLGYPDYLSSEKNMRKN
jgi:hypothetical protein